MLTNAYDLAQLVRNNIDESTAAHWGEVNILRLLNQAHQELYRKIALTSGQWFVTSASVTCTASVITLPVNCSKPVYLEDPDGYPVKIISSVAMRRVSRTTFADDTEYSVREAYLVGNTLEINKTGVSGTYTLWYQKKPVELHAGTAAAGGATSLTLAASLASSVRDDYYNNTELEVVSGTGIGRYTISDFVASTRVCTMASGTFGADSVYGIVPSTPDECNDYIALRATILALSKPSSNIDEKVFQMFYNNFQDSTRDIEQWISSRFIEANHVQIWEPYP